MLNSSLVFVLLLVLVVCGLALGVATLSVIVASLSRGTFRDGWQTVIAPSTEKTETHAKRMRQLSQEFEYPAAPAGSRGGSHGRGRDDRTGGKEDHGVQPC